MVAPLLKARLFRIEEVVIVAGMVLVAVGVGIILLPSLRDEPDVWNTAAFIPGSIFVGFGLLLLITGIADGAGFFDYLGLED